MDEQAVLVVDDDDSYRELLTIALQNAAGVRRVGAYATGAAAIAAIASTAPHRRPFLALLDFHLPGMTGLSVLRQLNELGYSGRCAVISNAASPDDRAACEAAGAVFLHKPARYDDLVVALAWLADRRGGGLALP